MKKITLDAILPGPAYLEVRDDFRREIIAYKKNRRVEVGPQLTFVFENRKTTLFQIQEILRVEGISDPAGMQAEIDVYNAILPGEGELAATVMITFSSTEDIRAERARLVGLMEHVALQVGTQRIPARFEEGRETDERISAVQYLSFAVGSGSGLCTKEEITLVVDHPAYSHQVRLWPEMIASLRADLEA